ncbi:hypothetical protein BUE93_20615, partial [Chromobacterium amazonense]
MNPQTFPQNLNELELRYAYLRKAFQRGAVPDEDAYAALIQLSHDAAAGVLALREAYAKASASAIQSGDPLFLALEARDQSMEAELAALRQGQVQLQTRCAELAAALSQNPEKTAEAQASAETPLAEAPVAAIDAPTPDAPISPTSTEPTTTEPVPAATPADAQAPTATQAAGTPATDHSSVSTEIPMTEPLPATSPADAEAPAETAVAESAAAADAEPADHAPASPAPTEPTTTEPVPAATPADAQAPTATQAAGTPATEHSS